MGKHEGKKKGGDGVGKAIKDRWSRLKRWQKILIITIAVLVILSAAVTAYVINKLNKVVKVDLDTAELSCVDVNGYINILLIGVDSRDMDMESITSSGGDALMIVSIEEATGEVTVTSIYRDTYMRNADTGVYTKITDIFRQGGVETTIRSINESMDLNIENFVAFNFKSVADLVDAVGGIELDIEEYELQQLNKYTIETAEAIGRTEYSLYESAGTQTVDGVQAVSYGRIRKGVGDDFKRTERMRTVLEKVLEKVQTLSLTKIDNIIDTLLPQFLTNLSNTDILLLGMKVMDFNITGSDGFPYDVTTGYLVGGVISYVFPTDWLGNVTTMHEELFDQVDYEPSETVIAISEELAYTVAYGISQSAGATDDETEVEDPIELPESMTGSTTGNEGTGDSSAGETSNTGDTGAGTDTGTGSGGESSGTSEGDTGGTDTGGTDTGTSDTGTSGTAEDGTGGTASDSTGAGSSAAA